MRACWPNAAAWCGTCRARTCCPGSKAACCRRRRTRANGTLFPQPWIAQGGERVRFDALAGNGWWLVLDAAFDGRRRGRVGAVRPRMTTLRLGDALRETEGVAADWFRRHGCRAAIVRPDRYVYGVAATAAELAAQLDALAARLG